MRQSLVTTHLTDTIYITNSYHLMIYYLDYIPSICPNKLTLWKKYIINIFAQPAHIKTPLQFRFVVDLIIYSFLKKRNRIFILPIDNPFFENSKSLQRSLHISDAIHIIFIIVNRNFPITIFTPLAQNARKRSPPTTPANPSTLKILWHQF